MPLTPVEPSRKRLPSWRVASYVVYEAGDSAWSLIVVSVYFGAFVQNVLHKPGADFGWALALANALTALVSPLAGAAADVGGKRKPYLRLFISGAALCTAGIGLARTSGFAMALFTTAFVCVNAAFTLYTALLPAVSEDIKRPLLPWSDMSRRERQSLRPCPMCVPRARACC
ncbi:MAG: hypothetical protein ACXWIE_21650 [Burkholderiales bacterium]